MNLFVVLLVVFGISVYPPAEDRDNKELQSFIKEFEDHTGKNVNIVVGFGDNLKSPVIGACYYKMPPVRNRVVINRSTWDRFTHLERKALVWHELMHCVCYSNHDSSEIQFGCPASLMHPMLAPHVCIQRYKREYIEDMNRRCK